MSASPLCLGTKMILCLLQKSFASHTKCLSFPHREVQEISRTPLLPHEDMWPGLHPSHQPVFASALPLPHRWCEISPYTSFLPYLLLGDIQGMLLSDASKKLKYAIFPHACCNGKIFKNSCKSLMTFVS